MHKHGRTFLWIWNFSLSKSHQVWKSSNIYTYYRDSTYIHRAPGYYSCLDNSGTRVQMHTFEISAIKLYRADCFERRAILLQDINRNCQIYCDQIVFQLLQYRLNIDSWVVQFQEELIYTLCSNNFRISTFIFSFTQWRRILSWKIKSRI